MTRIALLAAMVAAGLLSSCALPERAPTPLQYDFGPAAAVVHEPGGTLPALAIRLQASPALESQAMLYRLAYADAQQLRAYAQARWAMPPAELLQQRLRDALSREFTVLRPGEGTQRVLQLELDEFSQIFETVEQSSGLVRLRATVLQQTPAGEQPLGQRSLQLRRPAASADAAGGVRALSAATDAAATELTQWLQTLR